MANTQIQTNFNTSPWFDDYNEEKGFYKIPFKPKLAVQVRELNQIQEIQHQQVKRFADNIYKDGSLITGGQFTINLNYDYIKVNDTDPDTTNPINISTLIGRAITSETSGVNGVIIDAVDGAAAASNTKTLFIKYTSSGTDTTTSTYTSNEVVLANNNVRATVLSANTAVGKGSVFTISRGVVYAKGYFINFSEQSIILERYSQTPSYNVGFNIEESIVTYLDDPTLLDNANGSTNYTAPGADRFKLSAVLTKYPLEANTGLDFVPLFSVKNGIIESIYDKTQYNVINDEMARRTFDDAGDFYLNGLNINLREHLDTGDNGGYLTQSNGGNNSLLAVGVEPGAAYIKGYKFDKLVTEYTTTPKGIDYILVSGQTISAAMGNYVTVKEVVGAWNVNAGDIVNLYDTAQQRLSQKRWSTAAQTGNLIGTARFKALELDTGNFGTYNATYKLYLYDIKMSNSVPFTSVKNVYLSSVDSSYGADVVLNSGLAQLQETDFNTAIYPLPLTAIRKVRGASDVVDTSYTFQKSFAVSIGTGGTFSISTGSVSEIFPYTNGALDNASKHKFRVVLSNSANVALSGTVSTSSSSNTITGVGTTFTNLNVGDKIQIATVTGTKIITNIANNTSLNILNNAGSTVSGKTFRKYYYPGDTIDFTLKGATGTTRTITQNSTTSASFDMKETLSTTISAIATTNLTRTSAQEIKKVLRKNRLVMINITNSGTTGPYDLGFTDVFRINYVRVKTGIFTTTTQGTDVTSQFTLDNGQRDNSYDGSRLIVNGATLVNGQYLLISLDYFNPDYSQGVGYFSVDSYPIDDVNGYANSSGMFTYQIPVYQSPVTKISYDLRNCIDMRPVKTNTSTDTTTVGSASISPTNSTTFNSVSGGIHYPTPDSNMNMDFSYYLNRRDLVVLTKDGSIRVIKGTPALLPKTPDIPSDGMALSTLFISAYPSLAPDLGLDLDRSDIACTITKNGYKRFTHRDVGTLQQRIDTLEKLAALSQLEQSAVNLTIPDANGLDRFKNGIFTDPFLNHSLADVTNSDYNISIDPVEQCARPFFEISYNKLKYASGSNIKNSNNVITLSYTDSVIAEQPYASDTRNAAGAFYMFKGTLRIDPAVDNWVDTTQLPAIQINDGSQQNWENLVQAWGTQWNSWKTIWTGVTTQDDVWVPGGVIDTQTHTTINQRTGTRLAVTTSATKQDLGDKVVDVSIIPYIRPQIIKCFVSGMKASTRIYTFFDGEAMSTYTTPANSTYFATGTEGDNVATDSSGSAYFLLRIPNDGTKKFRTGDRVIRVTDSITNSSSSTTSAEAVFSASGINQSKQDTIISTTVPSFHTETVTQTNTINNVITQFIRVNDPLGQTFTVSITESTIPGYFLSAIDLFFKDKDQTDGVIVEIRAVDNSGFITKTVVPYSQVSIDSANINTSEDGTVATNIKFTTPIYLLNNVQYAYVVKPINNNPNTTLWTAVIGNNDIATGLRITQQPFSGNLFISSDNNTWSAIQTEDMKFRLYRAVFNTNGGTLNIDNEASEKFTLNNISTDFEIIGETLHGDSRVTLTNVSGGSVANTYQIVGVTSGTIGSISKINSGPIYIVRNIPKGQSYISTENVTFKYANNSTVVGLTAKIGTETVPSGTLYSFKNISANNYTLELRNSTGNFVVGEKLRGQTSNTYGIVSALNNYKYSTLNINSSFLTVEGTAVEFAQKTTANNYTLDTNFSNAIINDNISFLSEKIIASRTNEVSNMSSATSLKVQASLQTNNNFVSPVIDLNKTYALAVHNIMNNTLTNETSSHAGSAINKYISQKVTLEDGQDAEDLNVYLASYQPSGTTVQVYCKILNGEDSNVFIDRPWTEMTLTSKSAFSSSQNTNDYIDTVWSLPTSMMTGSGGAVQYTNSNSVVFTGFKYFAIKIVMLSSDSAIVPKVKQLRAIALQI